MFCFASIMRAFCSCGFFIKSFGKKFRSKGSILVEFAIGVPVLIASAVAMHDIPKYARINAKMEFMAHEMINIFQNVSQNRANKKITKKDFAYAIYAAFLTYYGGGTKQYETDGRADQRNNYYFPHPMLFCVEGLPNGKAQILWMMFPVWYKFPHEYNEPAVANSGSYEGFSLVKTTLRTEINPGDILPNFTIAPGQIKMILDVFFFVINITEAAKHFGFWLLRPKNTTQASFFNTAVIFTPKLGLFSETPPS